MSPETVKISGLLYTVKEVDDHLWTNWGRIDHQKQTIFIDKTTTQEQKEIVLIHEVIHGILTQSLNETEHDEKMITCLSNGLWAYGYRLLYDDGAKENKSIV